MCVCGCVRGWGCVCLVWGLYIYRVVWGVGSGVWRAVRQREVYVTRKEEIGRFQRDVSCCERITI